LPRRCWYGRPLSASVMRPSTMLIRPHTEKHGAELYRRFHPLRSQISPTIIPWFPRAEPRQDPQLLCAELRQRPQL
jgi:hypothetical protein